MCMTLGTCHGRTHPGGKGCVHPVNHRDITEFFVIGASLVIGLCIPMESRGYQLFLRGVRQ